MREALAAALGARAVIVVARGIDAVAEVRAARGSGFVLLVIAATVPKLDRAMLLASLGPLAEDLAPRTRLAALDLGATAATDAVVAAAEFLATASSTTGQILRIA